MKRYLVLTSMLLLAFLVACGSDSVSAPELEEAFPYEGSLSAEGTTFVRPDPGTGVLAQQRDVPYDAVSFQVASEGFYKFTSAQTYDGYLLLYKSGFDPAAPQDNLVAYNDDSNGGFDPDDAPPGVSSITFELETDTEYTLVTTSFGNEQASSATFGSFTNTVEANAEPPPPTETLPEPNNDGFDIQLRFVEGELTDAQKQVFTDAASRWSAIITGDVSNLENFVLPPNFSFEDSAGLEGTLDDVVIDVAVFEIDGPSGILGAAGPRLVRDPEGDDPYLTLYGAMQFDIAEFEEGGFFDDNQRFQDTIVHEMGHVIGIGTLWDATANTQGVEQDPATVNPGLPNPNYNPRFTGARATSEYQTLLLEAGKPSEANVPIANTGGSGSINGHWRELTFDDELMTPYAGGLERLSRMTAASLGDIGYEVNVASEDINANYTLPLDPVPSDFAQTAPNAETYTYSEDFIDFSGAAGAITAAVQAVDLKTDTTADPEDETSDNPANSSSGCEAEDFNGFTAGNIALMQRGTCPFTDKIDNAVAAGATGIVMFNQGDDLEDPLRTGLFRPSLGDDVLPAVATTYDLGVALTGTDGLQVSIDVPVPEERANLQAIRPDQVIALNEILLQPVGTVSSDGKIKLYEGSDTKIDIAEELAKMGRFNVTDR